MLLCAPAAGRAEGPPSKLQANAGLNLGVAGASTDSFWGTTYFHLGARGDLMFGRSGPNDWGVGPMLSLGTNGFKDFTVATGASVHVPIHELLPFVVSAGPYLRRESVFEPGAFASLFWGTRSFNYHSRYVLAGGLLVEGRVGLGEPREHAIIVAVHADAQILALPVLFLINAFR